MPRSSLLCKFTEELSAAVESDGRSQARIAKDAQVDAKTLAGAMKGQPVRQLSAQRIAGALKRDLSELLQPNNSQARPNQTAAFINLCDKNLTGRYDIRNSWSDDGLELATCTAEAYPQNAEAFAKLPPILGSVAYPEPISRPGLLPSSQHENARRMFS